jgi:NAD(P)-dependent dehydrogenase (short-subunit alcohol dehydrogenase family)
MNATSETVERWFEGKVAIVTGAGLGIGRGAAEMLSDAGVAVVASGRSAERMTQAAERLNARGGAAALGLAADVSRSDDVRRLVDGTLQRFGRLDFLINCAGTRSLAGLEQTSLAAWQQVLDVQLTGTFLCCQAAIDPLLDSGGRIVNVSSLFAFMGRANGASYAAAKMGVVAFTKVLPQASGQERQDERARRAASVPLRRVGTPEDVGWAVLYLLGPGATWVTGQVLHVNGGAYLP